jgi:hypothetical protein
LLPGGQLNGLFCAVLFQEEIFMKLILPFLFAMTLLGAPAADAGMTVLPHARQLQGSALVLKAGEMIGLPPANLPGPAEPKRTPENIRLATIVQLRAKFDAASAGSNHLLTAEAARDAGWGAVYDRFAEIDRNHDGYVNFGEIETDFDAHSPLKIKRKAAVQVVE